MQELKQLAQGLFRPLGDDSHRAVRLVGYPADQAKSARFLPCVLSEVDSLHQTVDGGFQSGH